MACPYPGQTQLQFAVGGAPGVSVGGAATRYPDKAVFVAVTVHLCTGSHCSTWIPRAPHFLRGFQTSIKDFDAQIAEAMLQPRGGLPKFLLESGLGNIFKCILAARSIPGGV